MSARDELQGRIAAALRDGDYHSCMYQEGADHAELAYQLLPLFDAFRAEVLREAAAKIRAAGCQEVNWCGCPAAADLIDPDRESR